MPIAFQQQQRLYERSSMLRSRCIASLVTVPVPMFVRSGNPVQSIRLARLQTYLLDGSFEGHAIFDEVFSEGALCHQLLRQDVFVDVGHSRLHQVLLQSHHLQENTHTHPQIVS